MCVRVLAPARNYVFFLSPSVAVSVSLMSPLVLLAPVLLPTESNQYTSISIRGDLMARPPSQRPLSLFVAPTLRIQLPASKSAAADERGGALGGIARLARGVEAQRPPVGPRCVSLLPRSRAWCNSRRARARAFSSLLPIANLEPHHTPQSGRPIARRVRRERARNSNHTCVARYRLYVNPQRPEPQVDLTVSYLNISLKKEKSNRPCDGQATSNRPTETRRENLS